MKKLTELRVGLIVAIATALFGVFVAYNGWLASTVIQNSNDISKITASAEDSKNTIHEVLNLLLTKAQSNDIISQTATTIK